MMRETGGLAFFNSRPADVPTAAGPEFAFAEGLNMLSLALRLVECSSVFVDRGTGWPDNVRFLSMATMLPALVLPAMPETAAFVVVIGGSDTGSVFC